MKTILTLLLPVIFLALSACSRQWETAGAREAEALQVVRFDEVVEDFLQTGTFSSMLRLHTDCAAETRILVEDVLHLGPVGTDEMDQRLRNFYSDSTLLRLRTDVGRKFKDFSPHERRLKQAFAALLRQCPGEPLPKIFTLNSALRQSIVVQGRLVGISLDKYMGADYPLYADYFYPCQRVGLDASRLPQDCLVYYLLARYVPDAGSGSLAFGDEMLQRAKVYWTVARVLHLGIGEAATACKQSREWYAEHEGEVWKLLSRPENLARRDSAFLTPLLDYTSPRGYFADPASRGVGLWLGMRIIDSYMRRHPETTLPELLKITDSGHLLREAGYHPA